MGPDFLRFLVAYLFWVPWKWVGERLRRLVARERRHAFVYDGSCGLCGKTVAVLRRLDLGGHLEYLRRIRRLAPRPGRFPFARPGRLSEDHARRDRSRTCRDRLRRLPGDRLVSAARLADRPVSLGSGSAVARATGSTRRSPRGAIAPDVRSRRAPPAETRGRSRGRLHCRRENPRESVADRCPGLRRRVPPRGRRRRSGFRAGRDPRLRRRRRGASSKQMLAAGQLPELSALRARGGYSPLTPTVPAQTPVSWATFSTGLDPGGHEIFDFLKRDPSNRIPTFAVAEEKSVPFLFGKKNPGDLRRRGARAVSPAGAPPLSFGGAGSPARSSRSLGLALGASAFLAARAWLPDDPSLGGRTTGAVRSSGRSPPRAPRP